MRDIRKSFSGNLVLRGIDFGLQRGQIHALVGHNGAGKSTLMKTLSGNYADYQGQILIDGVECRLETPREALKRGIAIIYQDFSLVPDLSVADNIGLGREPKGATSWFLAHAELRARSAREAAALGIDLPMDEPVRRLGVAGQQLTEIVRACSQSVRILVMDEPTARLAPAEREHLFVTMRKMADNQGVGIVYISHFLEEVRQVADCVTILRDGRVVETGPSSRYRVDDLARLLVGSTDIATIGAARPATAVGAEVLALEGLSVAGRPGVDLTIAAGEIVGIAGLVGSGRTRLARAIIGDVPSRGVVRVDGRPLARRDPERVAKAGVVMVPEDRKISGLALSSSVEANVVASALGRLLSSFGFIRPGSRGKLASDMIRRFDIRPPDRTMTAGELSGGNAQKVLLARAVAARPKVMILDQPTAGVDVGAKAELHRQIERSADEGAGVLLISDDLDELLGLCSRIMIISAGKVKSVLPSAELTRAQLLSAIS
ncbi:MAG: sugar ABC transporter ATP-binding protein [Ancalomicrobiaceae bacterium]|nr:sugar ABC transporter ATP-binding protein [Ancalomicrobiaceae bacterium]